MVVLLGFSLDTFAQGERKFVRKGNKQYEKNDFTVAEVNYLRALDKDSTSYEAIFNLGDALYKQEKYEDALARFGKLAQSPVPSPYLPSVMYNMGNTHFETKKYEEAVEAYKMSLRLNPQDTTAKFNLAYAQLMLKKDQQQQQDNKDNKDNKDDKDKDKKDQNKDQKDDQNKDQKDKPQDQKGDGDKDKDQQQQPEPKISKDQAEKMLQAIQSNEDKTQQKVKEKKEKGAVVGGSRKNW